MFHLFVALIIFLLWLMYYVSRISESVFLLLLVKVLLYGDNGVFYVVFTSVSFSCVVSLIIQQIQFV